MKKLAIPIIILLIVVACKEPEPRRPVLQKSGSFIKESVERSQRILEHEEGLIKAIIEKDTLHNYMFSSNGFWYHYEIEGDSAGYLPQTNDELLLTYNVQTFSGDTIYTVEDIGLVQHAVDKSQLFPGLRNAVKLLRKGERATFLFPSSQGYGYKGDNDRIGPNTPIKSSLTLLEIKKDSSNLNIN